MQQEVQNLAPKKPLYDLSEERRTPSYITDALLELLKDILGRDDIVWKEIAETTETVSNFIQGKQIFIPTTNGWIPQTLKRADPNRITGINMMQFLVSQNLKQIVASNPDLEPADIFKRSFFRQTVQKNKAVWNAYEKQFYTTRFNQQEALHAIISGTYIESVQYDHLTAGAKVLQDIWGTTQVPINEGYGQCFKCELKERYEAFTETGYAICPQCQSSEVLVEEPVMQEVPTVVGKQEIQTGDFRLKLIPIQAVRFNLKEQAEHSSYFLERFTIPLSKLQYILGKQINFGQGDTTNDNGLQAIESIAKTGNTLYGRDSIYSENTITTNEIVIDRLSLSASDYAHIVCREEETVSGQKIKAGQKMTDVAPKSCTVLIANQKYILGIYPDVHHSQEIASGTYHSRLMSGIGRGIEDAIEIQKRFNRQDAQMVRAGETGATPAHFFVEGAVDKKHIASIGLPGRAIPIKQSVVASLGTTDLVRQIAPSNIAGTFFQYTYEILDKYLQMTAHAPNVNNGLTGANRSGTATEAQISQSNADSIYVPMLQIKAEVRKQVAHLTLKGFAKHFQGVGKYFTFGVTKQGVAVGETIKGEDVDPDVEFVVVAESERPKSRLLQQNAFAYLMQITGGAVGVLELKTQAPELLDKLLETFDISLEDDSYDTLEDLCWDRLRSVLDIVKEYQQMTQGQIPLIPEIVLMGVKPIIRPTEPNHQHKMKWFSDFLDTPDGRALSEEERDGIDILIEAHRNGGVIQTGNLLQAETEAQMMAQQPMLEQQQALQDEQMNREMTQREMEHQYAKEERNANREDDDRNKNFEMTKMMNEQTFQAGESERKANLEREKIQASKAKK